MTPTLVLIFSGSTLLISLILSSILVARTEVNNRELSAQRAAYPVLSEIESQIASLGAVHDSRRQQLEELDSRLTDLRREKAEAEREAVDAQHWQQMTEQAKRDYEGLDDKNKEVDQVKDQFEQAANALSERKQEIDDLLHQRGDLFEEIGDIEVQRDEAEALKKMILERQERLDKIRMELTEIEDQRNQLLQARYDVEQLEKRHKDLVQALESLPSDIDALQHRRDELAEEIDGLKANALALMGMRDEIDRLTERKLGLGAEIESLKRDKDRLDKELGGRTSKEDTDDNSEEEEKIAVADLFREPGCLFDNKGTPILLSPSSSSNEQDALDGVMKYIEELGLKFEFDLIKLFHTCLKTSRITPLTVLAGISGTGKSQLPQRYAEGMGIPFLKAAVQPRWDSPQDLLGFYNYLEKKYKATELARALTRLDRHPVGYPEGAKQLDDRMLLVLLDEMNLARVEYYFSEFLSRLEARPPPHINDEALLRSSRIDVEVPLKDHKNLSIYPGHNTLFVGTMNEDESTQALSDKVIDRANTIRFPRPLDLVKRTEIERGRPLESFLSFKDWSGWYRDPNTRVLGDRENDIKEFTGTLNKHLDRIGRPFGHRINQAIFSYVANHPDYQTPTGYRIAVKQMMEMRILPKLRGIELEREASRALNGVADELQHFLQEDGLSVRIKEIANGDTIFNWTPSGVG